MQEGSTVAERGRDEAVPALGPSGTGDWLSLLREELRTTIIQGQGRWSRGLFAIAGIHLATFVICHLMHRPGQESDPRHLLAWFLELVSVFVAMRLIVGKGWFWSPPAIHLIGRIWLTFLILSFSLSTLNAALGWQTLWFKAAWGTLSSFVFAVLAWLFTPWFLALAVQMYATALLMARFMDWNNLIYGGSWCLALCILGIRARGIERGGRWNQPSMES